MKKPYLLSCGNVYGCENCARRPESGKQQEVSLEWHPIKQSLSNSCHFQHYIILTHPWPIFSQRVYFFLGSPILTIVPKSQKNSEVSSTGARNSCGSACDVSFPVCVSHTEFLHDLLIGHLASLLLLSVSCLRGGIPIWSWEWVYHRPRVHLTQQTKEKCQKY